MEKLATNVDEQIAKLESRGMTIGDKDKARECLLDIGYFRLGFYWFPFEKSYPRKVNRTHEFKDGACFEYAIRLYYFDYDLRNILLKYINRVEINFRTKLIYHASNRYKQDPFWYQDSKYVNKVAIQQSKRGTAEVRNIKSLWHIVAKQLPELCRYSEEVAQLLCTWQGTLRQEPA